MVMVVIMPVVMVMIMVMLVIMMMVMGVMIVTLPVLLFLKMPVKVLHVVVVTIVFFVRDHVKVTALDPRLFHTADLYPEMTARDPVQDMLQFSAVRPQIQKRRDHHIAADPRTALEIQNSITVFQSLFLRRQAG